MTWVDIINDPNIQKALVGLVGFAIKFIYDLINVKIPQEILAGAANETIGYLSGHVNANKEKLKKDNVYLSQLRDMAINTFRSRALKYRPQWVPVWAWKKAINKLSDQVISMSIEGMLVKQKEGF